MDIADQASDFEERDRRLALRAVPPAPVIEATGECLCCETALPDGKRWCDAGCRDLWQRAQKRA